MSTARPNAPPAVEQTAGLVVCTNAPGPRRGRRLLRGIVVVASLLTTALAAVVLASGTRVFVVESPSMGRAAPVGTLVVDLPVRIQDIAIGDVISYRPPDGSGLTYTHRVVAVQPAGIRTRGDINGAPDPWLTPQSAIVGRAVMLVPGVGWLVRGAPFLADGGAVLWMLTTLIRSATWRSGIRVLGFTAVVSGTCAVLKPLTGYTVLTRMTVAGGERMTAVSTGMLPIRLQAAGGGSMDLPSGGVGTLFLPIRAGGRIGLQSALALDPVGWLVIAALCFVPLLWILVVGLPVDDA